MEYFCQMKVFSLSSNEFFPLHLEKLMALAHFGSSSHRFRCFLCHQTSVSGLICKNLLRGAKEIH